MKRILLKTLAFIACIALALVLFVLPYASFLGMAFLTDSLVIVSLIAVLVFACVAIPGMVWLSGRISRKKRQVAVSVALAIHFLLTLATVYVLFLQALPGIDISMPFEPDGYWDLETGSRIAFRHTPAQGERRQTPVIRLHGGYAKPEIYHGQGGKLKAHPLNQLAALGFDVYHYDQVGCGNSSRLDDPFEYSVDRDVQDLEAIRKKLGEEKIMIVGISWGSMLAAHYAAEHPDQIAAIIFESPGWICQDSRPSSEEINAISKERLEWKTSEENMRRIRRMRRPRRFMRGLVNQINQKLACKLISDQEMSELKGLYLLLKGNAQCYYEPDKFPRIPPFGTGAYASTMISNSLKTAPDPRPVLTSIMSPVLVIRGDYEWLPKRIAQEYVDAFPNAQLKELQNCGHLLCREKPEEYYRTVEEFLLREFKENQK